MVGGRPQLMASFHGGAGSGGDLFEGVPVTVVAGVVDESEQAIEVALEEQSIEVGHIAG
jgi:hypothetical protein